MGGRRHSNRYSNNRNNNDARDNRDNRDSNPAVEAVSRKPVEINKEALAKEAPNLAHFFSAGKELYLKELKEVDISELVTVANHFGIENASSLKRQELIFALLQVRTEGQGDIYGEGVLETLPDGFGFLRSVDFNYLPGPDDIYVSPSQIRRFNLRTGDTVFGQIRPPKEG